MDISHLSKISKWANMLNERVIKGFIVFSRES